MAEPMTDERLVEIRARWVDSYRLEDPSGALADSGVYGRAFIAHARQDISDLLAEIDRQQEVIGGMNVAASVRDREKEQLRAELQAIAAKGREATWGSLAPGDKCCRDTGTDLKHYCRSCKARAALGEK